MPGDGIGTEVTREAVRVLRTWPKDGIITCELTEGLLGGIAIHQTGTPFPEETARLAAEADATLMGAVGLPEFDNAPPEKRPEKGLLGIRKALGVYANLRPVRAYASLLDSSPLEESPGGRHRYDHRPRTDGRDLLRHAARHLRKTARKRGRSIP